MPERLYKPPVNLINEWPEVFADLHITTMPINYLNCILIEFSDGRIWEISISDQLKTTAADILSEKLLDTLKEYKSEIKKIDIKLDVDRLKKDIIQSSKSIL